MMQMPDVGVDSGASSGVGVGRMMGKCPFFVCAMFVDISNSELNLGVLLVCLLGKAPSEIKHM